MKYKNVVIVGDFNCDYAQRNGDIVLSTTGSKLQTSLLQFDYTVVNNEPTRVTRDTSTLIDLVIASRAGLISNTRNLELGISDHMLVYACVQTRVRRPPPKIVKGRTFKNFNRCEFIRDLEDAPWSVCSVFDDPDDCYWAWSNIFNDICNRHAPYREVKIRSQSLPWITPQIRHTMNQRFKILLMARRTNNEELWKIYRELRNKVTLDVRKAKCHYYTELFAEVKDCKSYWRLIKDSACFKTSLPIMAMKGPSGETETSDLAIANILNEHFATIGEKLASGLPQAERRHPLANLSRVTPTVMTIDLTTDILKKALFKLKPDKASGPDHVSSKLLKYAGNVIIPSLMSVFTASTASNSVPATWKLANVSSLYKSGDETDKHNYRPISLLSVPGKLMESCIGSIITTHITNHDLRSRNQWAYRKGYSTELLLVKMTEDWRTALDSNLVVGIVFVDFRKAFDSISHSLLLQKLQGLGISGDLWSWIKDYLSERHQVTVINGSRSSLQTVKFGVPQGSVLGPLLFALFCNDLPNITDGSEGELHMYADDTTIYVAATSPDKHEALLHNFKPTYFLDKGETLKAWAKLIPEPWEDNRLITVSIGEKEKHSRNKEYNYTRLSEMASDVLFRIEAFFEEQACVTLKAETNVTVGCPLSRHIIPRGKPISCDSFRNYSFVIPRYQQKGVFLATGEVSDKTVEYDLVKLGCPFPVQSNEPFKPIVDLYDGETFVKEVDVNYVMWEQHGRKGYKYSATMKENYQSCFQEYLNGSMFAVNLDQPYEIFNSSAAASHIVWDDVGTFVFMLKVIDPDFSFCNLTVEFGVQVRGVRSMMEEIPTFVVLGSSCLTIIILLLSAYYTAVLCSN
ncbi:hypothetical protein ACROYT_G042525 [Oculina patagonica]